MPLGPSVHNYSKSHEFTYFQVHFRTLSKTWLVTQGRGNQNNDTSVSLESPSLKVDTPTQEQHWGEILERTVSKQNLMLLVNGTNGTILNHNIQTFPKRGTREQNSLALADISDVLAAKEAKKKSFEY